MSDRPWKKAERLVAAAVGGVRDTFAFAVGDVRHPTLAVDVKKRRVYSLASARADLAKLEGANAGKTAMVVHFDVPGRGRRVQPLVILRLADFAQLVRGDAGE